MIWNAKIPVDDVVTDQMPIPLHLVHGLDTNILCLFTLDGFLSKFDISLGFVGPDDSFRN